MIVDAKQPDHYKNGSYSPQLSSTISITLNIFFQLQRLLNMTSNLNDDFKYAFNGLPHSEYPISNWWPCNHRIKNEQKIPIASSVIHITLLHDKLFVVIYYRHIVTRSISSSLCSNTEFVRMEKTLRLMNHFWWYSFRIMLNKICFKKPLRIPVNIDDGTFLW